VRLCAASHALMPEVTSNYRELRYKKNVEVKAMVTSAHVEASPEPEAKQKTPARETPVLERRPETKISQKPKPKAIPG